MGRQAIFLDRDGVLNENRSDHVLNWSQFRFLPGVLPALQKLAQLTVPILGVTNQAVIDRGMANEADIDEIHERMLAQVERGEGRIDRMYLCPHDAGSGCDCRKPEPGLLLQAARDFDIDLDRSVFIGDAITDVIAGQRVGCATVLVRTGRGRQAEQVCRQKPFVLPDAIVDDLQDAVPVLTQFLMARSIVTGPGPVQRGVA